MKQIFLSTILTLSFTFANTYQFKLNKNDMEYINKSSKKRFIKNRLKKYDALKIKVVDYKLMRKLSHVNSFVNKILPAQDIDKNSSEDYWATPKEFLLQGHGDCEDYAITKYFTLLELGIPKNKLYFAVVNVKGQSSAHMVLLYKKSKNSSPLVLDNLSRLVVPFTKRKKLIPKFAFNEINSYRFTPEKFTEKINLNWGKSDKWNKLLRRVYILNE